MKTGVNDNTKDIKKNTMLPLSDKAISGAASPFDSSWDYEFQQSTKTYDDALFANDQALHQALDQATQTQKIAPKVEPSPSTKQDVAIKTASEVFDFSIFLSSSFDAPNNETDTPNNIEPNLIRLLTVERGINGHPTPVANRVVSSNEDFNTPPLSVDAKASADFSHASPPLLRHAKQLVYKTKAAFDNYFGRSLPKRTMALEFQFLTLKPKHSFESIATANSIQRLFSLKGTSSAVIFKQADLDLGIIVKSNLSRSHKLRMVDLYAAPLAERIRALITLLERKPCSPGDSRRMEMTHHAQNAIKHLIWGYKQAYQIMYAWPNFVYGPRRNMINARVFRLLDLLCLEQQLATALLRALPAGSIKVFNTLYSVVKMYEPALLEKNFYSLALDSNKSIQDFFLRYQLAQCFDMNALSVSSHKILYQYLQVNMSLLAIKSSDQLEQITQPCLMVLHNQGRAATLVDAIAEGEIPCTLIQTDLLFNQIKNDYCQSIELLGKTPALHSSPVFMALPWYQSLSVLSVLYRGVLSLEQAVKHKEYTLFKAAALSFYGEFVSCVAFLNYRYIVSITPPKTNGEPIKNATIKPIAGKNTWLFAMEDADNLYMQSSEIKSDYPLDVGNAVLFLKNVDEIDHLQLALITRVERIQHGKLNVVAKKIANDVTHALLETDQGQQLSVILAAHDGVRYLVCSNKERFWTGKKIKLVLPEGSNAQLCIKELHLISQKVQVLSLY